MEEASSSPERSVPKLGLLCRGWRIGKKLAVAGAAVTTAPLVVPPLLVLSTVGLVCAVPVCVYLAAFAATERVMTSMLPIPSDEEPVESEVGVEPLDMVYVCVVKEKGRMDDDDDDDDDDVRGGGGGEERSLMDVERESLIENEKGEVVVLMDEEKKSEQVELGEKSGDGEGLADAAVQIENPLPIVSEKDENGENSAMNNGKEEDELSVMEYASMVENANGEVIVIFKELKIEKDEFLNAPETEKTLPTSQISVAPVDKESSEYASAVEDQSSETADSEIQISTELVTVLSVDQTEAMDKDEGKFNEEKIWEEIYALRTIMGYQGALSMSCVEELTALYIFAGVEPPANVKDSPKLKEVNDMLLFLKSVIGVK
ncbi:FK506-binding protein 5-like [Dioscorea cayenensis subsp. rotundata]|uniref:FK506-binding protein 5-like n=1 Tax=Dioscorea cayennensis subsp. rotundata TaxID=55577 RepID=A0AB40BGR4_DIOCR|nr:FK506-binding protein 5-like [Dioscorea cayenensis subsp. rotundata]